MAGKILRKVKDSSGIGSCYSETVLKNEELPRVKIMVA
jgi:hypothetical protein